LWSTKSPTHSPKITEVRRAVDSIGGVDAQDRVQPSEKEKGRWEDKCPNLYLSDSRVRSKIVEGDRTNSGNASLGGTGGHATKTMGGEKCTCRRCIERQQTASKNRAHTGLWKSGTQNKCDTDCINTILKIHQA